MMSQGWERLPQRMAEVLAEESKTTGQEASVLTT